MNKRRQKQNKTTAHNKHNSKNQIADDVILKLSNVEKHFGKKKVLKGVNLEIKRKEFLAIVGENGAGKTTLVEIIAQTLKHNAGSIQYNFLGSNIKKNIGVQFQEGNWPAGLNARDILSFFKGVYGDVSNEKIEELSETFEIKEFEKRGLTKLSGGQKQRFNALLAILHNPELVIFDELTTGLDVQLQYKIAHFINDYRLQENSKQTFILVSHGPEEIEGLADRVILISDGVVFVDYSMSEIKSKFKTVRNMLDLYFKKELKTNLHVTL